MALDDTILHLVNLLLPAWALPALLVGLGRLARQRQALVRTWWGQWLCHQPISCGVMLAGLFASGQDGQMETYAALVLLGGSTQWVLLRGWRSR